LALTVEVRSSLSSTLAVAQPSVFEENRLFPVTSTSLK
jgi:hypothetical protein